MIEVFKDWQALSIALYNADAIKIATWHGTANIVNSSLNGNKGFYLVQDIETSFYDTEEGKNFVLGTYQLPLELICEGEYVENELKSMGREPTNIGIAIDHDVYYDRKMTNSFDQLFHITRKHKLKGLEFINRMKYLLPEYKFRLKIPNNFPDNEMAIEYSRSLCYLMTSTHEGFCLPALEAMACGCPVITRMADGNEEFCNKDNSIICETPQGFANAIEVLSKDDNYRNKLIKNGLKTAAKYQWKNVIDKLETVLKKY
jgi:hypothetical protein